MEFFNNIIKRRKTRQVFLGKVKVGSDSPITVQSMTNTLTSITATVDQIKELEEAGADLVRVSCPDEKSTKALKKIVEKSNIPIIADIHFHSLRAIEAADKIFAACFFINPVNIGNTEKIKSVVDACKKQ